MGPRRYGAEGLEANREALAAIGRKRRDNRLLADYLCLDAESDHVFDGFQAAYIHRAMNANRWTFADFVHHLIAKWAAENAR